MVLQPNSKHLSMSLFRTALLLAFSIMNIVAHAQIVTDRPDQTESSITVPLGAFQIESGVQAFYQGNTRTISAPNFLLRYGLGKKFELRLFNQRLDVRSPFAEFKGMDDLQFGAKLQLFDKESSSTKVALLSHMVIPSGTGSFQGNYLGTITRLCISHSLTESLGLAYNIGYQYYGQQEGDIIYSMSLSKAINKKFSVYIEPFGEWDELEVLILNFDTGFTYQYHPHVQFDFTYGLGIYEEFSYIAAGVSCLINKE